MEQHDKTAVQVDNSDPKIRCSNLQAAALPARQRGNDSQTKATPNFALCLQILEYWMILRVETLPLFDIARDVSYLHARTSAQA